jgi:RNA polymerase sigma factor (sigma-70 family)
MSSTTEFNVLMDRLATGCPDAPTELFEHYGKHVRKIVRFHLGRRLRREFDSLDFTQEVWTSFFAQAHDRERFAGPKELAAFLARIARNKIADRIRDRVRSRKRALARTQPLDSALLDTVGNARTPSPSQVFAAREQWELLVRGQSSRNQRMLELLREEYTHAQIGKELGLHEKTVQRLLARLATRSTP